MSFCRNKNGVDAFNKKTGVFIVTQGMTMSFPNVTLMEGKAEHQRGIRCFAACGNTGPLLNGFWINGITLLETCCCTILAKYVRCNVV